jgi:isopenicillin N synthase-like dioxygenase
VTVPTFSLAELTEAAGSSSGGEILGALDAALRDPGAFKLVDVKAVGGLIEDMHRVTCSFFELPMEAKARYRYPGDQYVGWCGGEYLSQYGSSDRKEMFHIGPRVAATLVAHGSDGMVAEPSGAETANTGIREAALASCSLWPATPTDFVAIWHRYYRAMQATSVSLGRAFTQLLGTPEQVWFDALGGNWADLAANYYPPVGENEPGEPVYNAAHRDLTVFTILYQDQSRAGHLSVQSVDGSWHVVDPSPESYVVNVGELLTYLSGGRWPAAPHRVTVAEAGSPATVARISIPFFYRPSDERVVSSFADRDALPVAVGDWVLAKKRGVPLPT